MDLAGVVAYCFTGTGNQSLALLDVEFFPIQRYWFIVHRKNKRLSATAQAFKQFVLDEGKAKQVG